MIAFARAVMATGTIAARRRC